MSVGFAGRDDAGGGDLPFRQVAQHLSTPCWISDAEGLVVWVNDAWIDYTGMTVADIQAKGLRSLHDPDVYDEVAGRWQTVKAAGEAAEMVFPLRGRDGNLRPFHTRVAPLRDASGKVTRWFGVNTDISDRSEAEARLVLSEEKLREVFDRAGDGIFITDAGGRLVDVNAAACALGQYSQAELLAMSVWDLVDVGQQTVLAGARESEDSIRDWRIKRKDGTFLEVEVSSRRLSDGRRLGVARDVTDRRLIERAERQALSELVTAQTTRATDAERQMRHFWDASHDLFAIVSTKDGVARMINERAWTETLGFSAAEITSRPLLEFVHPDDREMTMAMRRSSLAQQGYFGFENRYLHRGGHVVWLAWNVVREGELIYCNGRDISREKEDQDHLARTEGQFRLLVDGVVDYSLFMLSPTGAVESWNVGAQRTKGYSADEIVGQHVSVFYTEEDRRAGRPEIGLKTAAEQGRYEAEGWRVRKDGSLFWANVVLDAIRDADGVLLGYAKITRDITERRNAQLELQRANERLAQAQKMEALGQLTGGVAHDFNNLLMVVGGQAELLKRRIGEDERALRSVGAIAEAAKRGQVLTRHLLAFARRQRLNPAPVSFAARVADLQTLLVSSLAPSVDLVIDCPEDIWTVEVDINELELALLNMAVNARDAMPSGGRLRISAENRTLTEAESGPDIGGDVVELTITDSGVGIPEDILPKVIDPFFSTKGPNKGTGLGLSQVYGFVKQSGGRMTIDSALGEGTTISLLFPRVSARPAAAAPATSASPVQSLDILCVEDNVEVADVAGGLLQHLGHGVRVVNSAAEAMELLQQGPRPSLVFSDIVMAGEMDGLGLAREIRQRWPDLPVLLATGYSREADAIGDEFPILPKPYHVSELSGALSATLDRWRSVR